MPKSCENAQSTASEAVQALYEMLLQDHLPCEKFIQDALKHPAWMAPVTDEQNGEEMAFPNPTRLLLFRTLQRKLQDETTYWDCLVRALQVARALEGTRKHANGTFCDVPVAWMLQYATDRLDVVWAFLQRHPETSRAFVNVLLFQETQNMCACKPASAFLQRMHQETTVAASILTLAIQNWPLALWLKREGSYSQRLVQALESAIRVTNCCFQREKHSQSMLSLVQAILRHIPWHEKLRIPAMDLVESLTLSISDSQEALTVFLELCGGQITPQGDETPMSPFVRAWLDSYHGIQWFKNLLHQQKEASARKTMHPILCAILTSNFSMLGKNEDLWQLFQETFQSIQEEKQGFELMEAMLKGRHSESTLLRKLPPAWWEQFLIGLASDHSKAATACSCCGYLRAEDWAQQDSFDSILEAMVSICSNHLASAKWRSASLKALGDACSNLFIVPKAIRSQQNIILEAVITTMNDSNAQVRCMSLFVVGNLAWTLRSREAILQSIPLWITVADQCLAKVNEDANEKVINNAIRSIGQIAALFLVQPNLGQLISYVTEIVDALKVRIQMSLPNNKDAVVLSWKQRSARKRHCWGACNSVAIIFQSLNSTTLDCSSILETLVEVIEKGGNEKVVVSASKAIRAYNALLQVDLVPAIQCCVRTLEYDDSRSRLKEEMEMLLPVLLQNMTRNDASCWISTLKDSKDKVLSWLFAWMVSYSIPSQCFLVVSDAINRSGVQVDISVEQMFATAIRNDNDEDGDEL